MQTMTMLTAGNAKNAAFLQLFGQRNDVEVEKAHFSFVPAEHRSCQFPGLQAI
jgi:hypothetical protein